MRQEDKPTAALVDAALIEKVCRLEEKAAYGELQERDLMERIQILMELLAADRGIPIEHVDLLVNADILRRQNET
jgi:hypothetical protein